jgi:hypothetical protein
LPYNYPGIGPDEVFGYSGVKLAKWVSNNNDYDILTGDFSSFIGFGQGEWVRFPSPITIGFSGEPFDDTSPLDVTLSTGWNLIGDPYPLSVPLTSLTFSNNTQTFSQASSGTSPVIGSSVWGYDPVSSSYIATTTLVPQQGYWIYAYAPTDVQFPILNQSN